ncbi:PAS-domain containing protein [Rhodovulum sp. DZ06]|uniref:PAS-domain containing protein n=1 Tax=Rhodovulum sp. DZ06 TaxID=3425126 RepID=UPI003D3506A5
MTRAPVRSESYETVDPTLIQAGFNLIQQALTIFDADLQLVGWNARFTEMFALPRTLVYRGARFEDIIRFLVERGEYGPVRDGEAESMIAERVDRARAFEAHYIERDRPDGTTISIEGHPLAQGGWVAVYTDITAHRRQERLLRARSADLSEQLLQHSAELARANRELAAANAALTETQRALVRSEARARLATEATPAHIAYVDRDLVYRYSNRRLGEVTGSGDSEVIGRRMDEVLGAEIFDKIGPSIEDALAGRPARCEFRHRRRDGAEAATRVAFTPIFDDSPRPEGIPPRVRGFYLLSLDVTEERRAAEAVLQTKKMQAAAQLTRGLAHDFSNLLTVILGMQGRILDDPALPPAAREAAEATRAAARRGAALIERLSHVSDRRELTRARADAGGLLRGLAELTAPSLPPGVRLVTEIQAGLPPAWIDAGQLQDAALNLLLNARDAVQMAGTDGEITLSARTEAGADGDPMLVVAVTDDGPGFEAEARERAVEPFFSTKGHGGSGLGLSMVYGFATAAGGSLEIGAAPGRGACVTLRLPVGRPEDAGAADPGPDLSRPAQGPAPEGIALVADDSPDLRAVLRGALTDMGWPVLEAASGEEALDLAARIEDIRLVVSDIDMGAGLTGLDVAGKLAAARPELRVLLTTGLPADTPERRQAAEEGRAVLPKPFTAEELEARLAELRAPAAAPADAEPAP